MKKFFILFAATCIASAAWADAVYEPLIVSSGFNRDVIAESLPISTHAQSYYLASGIKYSYGTKSVIEQQMGYANDTTGFPDDGKVVCISQQTYPRLFWQLAPYGGPNALCMRQEKKGGLPDRGVLSFKNIGCYQKLYFLIAAAGSSQADSIVRELNAIVYYSSGDTTHTSFNFLDHSYVTGDKAKYKACHDNFFHSDNETDKKYTNPNAYAVAREMKIDQHQLIDSICLINVSRSGQNLNSDIAIILFAVTGLTADIAAPDANPEPNHAPLRATEITANAISVEWDAVEGAASYRIDVATDEDFHHMVEGFNNGAVITSPDTVITGLDADHEYYWRVRAVDSEGGQSASSAPRRVRTESNSGPQTSDEVHTDIKAVLDNYLQTTINLKIARVLYKDGSFNTLCLPFDYSADRIAAHEFLHGCELFTFDSAEQLGESQLDIHMSPATEITAGVPYLIRWANTGAVSDYLTFNSVTITKTVGDTVGDGTVRFIGAIGRQQLGEVNDKNYLFVGANNTLYWPNTNNHLRGYRAYFRIFNSGPVPAPRYGTPARIVLQPQVATGIGITDSATLKSAKRIENGQLIIVHGGVRYNVLGQKME